MTTVWWPPRARAGRYYELQHRYMDALALHGRTVDNIQKASGMNHEAIEEFYGWIHKAYDLWNSENH